MNKSVESMACKSFEETIELANRIKEQQQEIERLNNIINELEKYVIDREERSWDDNGAYDDVLDKLQELKGVDKDD